MSSSRIPAFYRMTVEERRQKLAETLGLSPDDRAVLEAADALPLDVADIMVENAVGTFALPFGVGLNFQINGRDIVIPMVVEEPSVIAAASNAALVARAGGGFVAEADPGAMIGQIQLVRVPDPGAAMERLYAARDRILTRAESLTPGLCRRGAGPRDIEVRLVRTPRDETMVVFHVIVDTGDAMGANAVNSLVRGAPPSTLAPPGGQGGPATSSARSSCRWRSRRWARPPNRIRACGSPSGCSGSGRRASSAASWPPSASRPTWPPCGRSRPRASRRGTWRSTPVRSRTRPEHEAKRPKSSGSGSSA